MGLEARIDDGRYIVSLWISERDKYSNNVTASATPTSGFKKKNITFVFLFGKFKQSSEYPIIKLDKGWILLEALNKISGKKATIITNEGNNKIYEKEFSPNAKERETQNKHMFDITTELQYAPEPILKSDTMTKRYPGDKLHGQIRKSAKSFSKSKLGGKRKKRKTKRRSRR